MQSLTPSEENSPLDQGQANDAVEKEAILRELDSILSSPFFRSSNRSKQFLSYVVHHTLEGNHEPLKERTIGAKLFQRPVGYATGDDPVVRVQAGEVRRRLEQYHHAGLNQSPVRIELPVGSYAPAFHWTAAEPVLHEAAAVEAPPAQPAPTLVVPVAEPDSSAVLTKKKQFHLPLRIVVAGLTLLAVLVGAAVWHNYAGKSTISRFWSPVFGSPEPVLVCLAKPTVYRPSAGLYVQYSHTPDEFDTEWKRLSRPAPLDATTKMTWGDMVEYSDYGVAAGDVYAALRLTAALNNMGKASQVRIGTNYSFKDLRNSPAIVIGAFNNRWTMQMTSNLHFAFVEENGKQMVREQGANGRTWSPRFGTHGEVIEDYGVVTRLLESQTGNFVVATAGIQADGTQAAAEFVSSPAYLEGALRNAPSDWTKKNLQFVVKTMVTDAVPGPPHVVATYIW
jgi:hypothetical protein